MPTFFNYQNYFLLKNTYKNCLHRKLLTRSTIFSLKRYNFLRCQEFKLKTHLPTRPQCHTYLNCILSAILEFPRPSWQFTVKILNSYYKILSVPFYMRGTYTRTLSCSTTPLSYCGENPTAKRIHFTNINI